MINRRLPYFRILVFITGQVTQNFTFLSFYQVIKYNGSQIMNHLIFR